MRIASLSILLLAVPASADELRLNAKSLFEACASEHVELSSDAASIGLEFGETFEDDGPAAGYSYLPNEETLTPNTWIKKELLVSDPRAKRAVLLVVPGGDVRATINGRETPLKLVGKTGNYWQAYSFSPDVLVPGRNEFVLSGSGKVYIARDDEFAAGSTTRNRHPDRSAKSTDGGKTWNRDGLGTKDNIDGEYCTRLFLERHRARGVLTSPVLDAGNLTGRLVAPPLAAVGPLRFRVTADGDVAVSVRTSKTPLLGDGWTAWQPVDPLRPLDPGDARYLQFQVELTTRDPLQSPQLKEIVIESQPRRGSDWTSDLKFPFANNPAIVRSSIPFVYEPFDLPALKTLRTQYRLDEVVAGAKSDFGRITRLAAWSARQWDKGHLRDSYPAWNALEILAPHRDGTPLGGFCQQFNLVFLQACQSFGIPGRAVSLGPGDGDTRIRGGHEVVEIWSNEHRKWVHVDGQMAWYFVDPKSQEPLSLLELADRQARELLGLESRLAEVVRLGPAQREWKSLRDWPPFQELRLIPRSNFLQERAPLPLNQGMRGWFWTGHYVWHDVARPTSPIYTQRVLRPGNWNWTLNQTHFTLEATATPGEVRVHLDTATPGFATFVASLDGDDARPVAASWPWKLHSGKNSLSVYSRNRGGVDGIVSGVSIEVP